jgi:hypothetical protein
MASVSRLILSSASSGGGGRGFVVSNTNTGYQSPWYVKSNIVFKKPSRDRQGRKVVYHFGQGREMAWKARGELFV